MLFDLWGVVLRVICQLVYGDACSNYLIRRDFCGHLMHPALYMLSEIEKEESSSIFSHLAKRREHNYPSGMTVLLVNPFLIPCQSTRLCLTPILQ